MICKMKIQMSYVIMIWWSISQAVVRKRMEAGKEAKAAYGKRLAEYRHEQKERHAAEVAKKKAKKN